MNSTQEELDAVGQVVKSVSIENLVNQRAAVIERFNKALELLREAEQIAIAGHVGFPRLKIDDSRYGGVPISGEFGRGREECEEAVQKCVDVAGWQYLMNESGLRTFMNAQARAKWDTGLAEGKMVPTLNAANVEATFAQLYAARGDMFDQGVIACFKSLSWHYKTNLPQKFGKRIVVTYLSGGGFSNHRKTDELDDLMRVFFVVDEKPQPDHRHAMYGLVNDALRPGNSPIGFPKTCENDYLSIRLFKNGNGHVTFKRLDLVEKLNAIIARHFPGALPAPKGGA